MKMIFIFCFILCSLILIWHFSTKKYLNPYKLYFLMGKKGSGKSTLLTKLRLQYLSRGYPVFSTEDIPGTYRITGEDIGVYEFPENSIILIDEVSLIWNNRDWKNLQNYVIEWYRFQRKRKLTVYLFSQTFDVDLKIRDLTDEMFLIKRYFRVLSVARRIDKTLIIHKSTAEAPSTIAEDYELVPLLSPNSIKITFIPKYTKYFTSFNPPSLDYKEFEKRPDLEEIEDDS